MNKLTILEEDKYWRESDIIKYYDKQFIELVLINKITNQNISEYIIPYFGNDYKKLNKEIDRNMSLLSSINNLINEGKDINGIKSFVKSNLQKQIKLLDNILSTEKFIIDPDFKPIINNKFDFIFVRHGISCANVISNEIKKSIKYFDPELTKIGIERTIELHDILLDKIKYFWKDEPYSIGSSYLIRAQETAFHMIAKQTGKAINILPYIAEKSLGPANLALPKDEQDEILKRNSGIIEALKRGQDGRHDQTIFTKSNYEMFLNWANNNLKFFEKGSDNIYRAVIFSHGVLLETAFDRIKPENNDIFHVSINESNYVKSKYQYFRVKPITDEYSKCPNDCRISYC